MEKQDAFIIFTTDYERNINILKISGNTWQLDYPYKGFIKGLLSGC